jgi:hypothetical protein
MQTLVCAIDEAEETQLTEDTELEIEEIDPGTVFVMSVAELQKQKDFSSCPGQIHGAILKSIIGKLTKEDYVCRGFGRRKGQQWKMTSKTLNSSNKYSLKFDDNL